MKKYKVTFEFEVDAAHGEKAALAAAREIYRQQTREGLRVKVHGEGMTAVEALLHHGSVRKMLGTEQASPDISIMMQQYIQEMKDYQRAMVSMPSRQMGKTATQQILADAQAAMIANAQTQEMIAREREKLTNSIQGRKPTHVILDDMPDSIRISDRLTGTTLLVEKEPEDKPGLFRSFIKKILK